MARFTAEEKIQAVKRYINGTEGHKRIAKEIGVSHGVFFNWIQQYQHHGEMAFEKRYTTYTVKDKLEVLQYMNENGTSINETAAIYNIPAPSTLVLWKKLFDSEGVDALNPKKKGRPSMTKDNEKNTPKQLQEKGSIESLQAEVERLRMENAYLKKLNALVQNKKKSPNRTKLK
jgi:transposase